MTKRAPETQMIAISCTDGSVAVMQFVTKQQAHENDPGWSREATAENIDAEIAKSQISAVGWRLMALGEIPQDRTFRNAWKDGTGKIDVDMPKAREIWRSRMRVVRVRRFAILDAAYLQADEVGNTNMKQSIAAQKQQLRDVTSHASIDAAATPEDLKTVWPAILNE